MFLKLYTNLYKTDMHKQASFVALNCLTVAKSLYNTSQINSWGYYLWFHFLRLSERYLQTLPFSSLQRFKLIFTSHVDDFKTSDWRDVTDLSLFSDFFRVDATDPSIDFFRVDRWKNVPKKIHISHDVITSFISFH